MISNSYKDAYAVEIVGDIASVKSNNARTITLACSVIYPPVCG